MSSRKVSSKGSKKHNPGHSSSGRSKGSSHDERIPTEPHVGFLFTVNELEFDEGDYDNYYHMTPPTSPARYTNEYPSRVMRYRSGDVTAADGYFWNRVDSQGVSLGTICAPDPETGEWRPAAEQYSQCAVMACNPLLPILVCPADPIVNNTHAGWQLLRIFHPRDQNLAGVSQVVHEDSTMPQGGNSVRYVAGHEPRWIPSLLPYTYRWPLSTNDRPHSRGLGGELSIILGLMALSVEPSVGNANTNRVFLGDDNHNAKWRNNRWYHNGEPRGYPQTSDDNPRGFLVTVFYDPENPFSTQDWLRWFEWQQAVVVES